MHDDRHAQLAPDLLGGGEMIRVRMRIDDVVKPQPVAGRERLIAIDLADLGIDERRRAAVRATDEIGLAAAGRDLFEQHGNPRIRPGALYRSWRRR
jgi:hypothetical protein